MTINHDVAVELSREERRRVQNEQTDALVASGALDDVFAKMDAGQPLTGESGLLNSLLKATLERAEHRADRAPRLWAGDADASSFENSRNGYSAKTVATEVGDVELQVRATATARSPRCWSARASGAMDGLDAMIVSLYAGGMTIRDIQHHLVSTLGTELSHETISKITEEVADEGDQVAAPRTRRPLPGDLPRRDHGQVRDGGHVRNKAAHIAVGVDMDGVKHVLGSGSSRPGRQVLGVGVRGPEQPRRGRCAHRVL